MSKRSYIAEPFEQILKHLSELKKKPELFSEIANIFEQIKQIETHTNTAVNTLQNYYLQFTKQVDTLSELIDFQTRINHCASHQETVVQIFDFLKEHIPYDDAFFYMQIDESESHEIISDKGDRKDRYAKFLTKEAIKRISTVLAKRDLGVIISDVAEDKLENVVWDLIGARSVIFFPLRMRGKLFGFGLLVNRKTAFQPNHLASVNLVSGFIAQSVFHNFYFARLKNRLLKQFEIKKDLEKHGYAEHLERGPLFIFTLDANGVIIHDNIGRNNRFLGQSGNHEKLIGKKFLNLVQQEHRKPLQNVFNQMREGDVRSYRAALLLGEQNERMLDFYITKVQLQSNFIMTIIFGVDVTRDYYKNELNNRNEVLNEISRFSLVINGYLENLLKEVEPNMNVLRASVGKNEALQKKFQMFEKYLQQTTQLVQSFVRFDIEETQLRKDVNINDIILEMVKASQPEFASKIEVKYSLDPGVPSMMTYPGKIKKLIRILFENSVEAIKDKGHIGISTRLINMKQEGLLKPGHFYLPKGNFIEIIFTDNGRGIDPRVLPQIFKPFFSTKIRNEGIGLGLFIAYNIVKDLEGEIFVKSEQNKYTTFYIYIPYRGDLEMQEILPGMADAIQERSPTILVVDDELYIRSMLKEVFEMNGYYVYTAANGLEGIEIFKKHADQIDLIILDMVMPVMDGKRAFFEIKKVKKDQKIIIISGYAKREDLREILDKGALAFMSKPFQIESIVDKVAEFMNRN